MKEKIEEVPRSGHMAACLQVLLKSICLNNSKQIYASYLIL